MSIASILGRLNDVLAMRSVRFIGVKSSNLRFIDSAAFVSSIVKGALSMLSWLVPVGSKSPDDNILCCQEYELDVGKRARVMVQGLDSNEVAYGARQTSQTEQRY